ncbi:hypothetical protein AVEN_126829-1 [Araneus ventricosus]|uniref:Uncharacterized protein n=1 Tax=Araneus ventricosus TaxID=182803 RepID=A0A4Y2HSM0_ARAVE|nr:hypothetical protein AVEN_126829-1 [Araneus ventricosus]
MGSHFLNGYSNGVSSRLHSDDEKYLLRERLSRGRISEFLKTDLRHGENGRQATMQENDMIEELQEHPCYSSRECFADESVFLIVFT